MSQATFSVPGILTPSFAVIRETASRPGAGLPHVHSSAAFVLLPLLYSLKLKIEHSTGSKRLQLSRLRPPPFAGSFFFPRLPQAQHRCAGPYPLRTA